MHKIDKIYFTQRVRAVDVMFPSLTCLSWLAFTYCNFWWPWWWLYWVMPVPAVCTRCSVSTLCICLNGDTSLITWRDREAQLSGLNCCSALTKLAKLAGEKRCFLFPANYKNTFLPAFPHTEHTSVLLVTSLFLTCCSIESLYKYITEDRRIIYISRIFPVWMWHITSDWQ